MRRLCRPGPDYGLCRRTVTLYHRMPGEGFLVKRILFKGAFLDRYLTRRAKDAGSGWENSFLLILPQSEGRPRWASPEEYHRMTLEQQAGRFTLLPGDKLAEGEGPELLTPADWAALDPLKGGCTVKEVAERRWNGRVCHIEAGGPQQLGRSGLPRPHKAVHR